MSGLLHPVGPESAHTYWARRAVLFLAAAVLAIAAALIIHGTSSGSEAQPHQPPAAYPVGSPTTGSSPAVLPAKPKAKSLDKVYLPQSGPGTYQAARKSVPSTSLHGALIRYDVRIEDGLSIDPDKAAVLIQGVLDDPRSWRGTRRWRFELVPVGQSATLHAYIVTPNTTDALCAPYLTRGEVSCQNGDRVVLNAKRWAFGVDSYGSDLTNYRRYLVNHEFGHALGKHHLDCPGRGRLAPVMMQQTKGLGAVGRTHGHCAAKIERPTLCVEAGHQQEVDLGFDRSRCVGHGLRTDRNVSDRGITAGPETEPWAG